MAMVTYSSEFGRFCLVTDIASCSFWTDLCSLWRYLYFTALMWLRFVDQVVLTRWDILGGLIVLCGAGLIILQPQGLIR